MPTLKKVNVGVAVICSAATWPRLAFKDVIFSAGGTRYHDNWASIETGKWTRKLWLNTARSIRGDVMWDGDCKTSIAVLTLS